MKTKVKSSLDGLNRRLEITDKIDKIIIKLEYR